MAEDGTAERISVRDVMDTAPATARADGTVEEVARTLVERGATGLPVVDDAGELVGVVSEHDVIAKRGRTVSDVMSRGVVTIDADADAAEAARVMGLHGIRLLPVLQEGRLAGVVGRTALVRMVVRTRWVCRACGAVERGLDRPDRCPICGGADFALEREA